MSTTEKVKKLVIVGGVAAGATAAARARRLDESAEITILERGPYVSFANCGLPYFLSGDIKKRSELILQTPEGFFSRYRVNVQLHTEVTAIDRAAKEVVVNTEEGIKRIPYDSLILAMGGSPIKPALPGIDQDHVFSLWTIPDMDRIHKHLKTLPQGAPVVVVGGGFIGLEAAEAFQKRGFATTVVEKAPVVLPHMDPEFGRLAQAALDKHGITVKTNSGLASISSEGVILESGELIPAQAVLLSIGVRPHLELARAAGLEIGPRGGLAVDEFLRTNDPAILGAGDMTEIKNRVLGSTTRIPLAGPANRQGRIAAENALGGNHRYPGALGSSVVRVMDLTLASTGLSESMARTAGFNTQAVYINKDQHVSYMPGASKVFFKLVFDQTTRKVLGAQSAGLEGAEKRIDVIAVALAAGFTVDQLADLDLAYAPPYNSAHDPVNMAAFVAQNHLDGRDLVMTPTQVAAQASTQGSTIVDVRNLGDFSKGHVKDAMNIPVDELRDRLIEVPMGRDLVVYCKDGSLGHIAARILIQHGFTRVWNMTGGATAAQLEPSLAWEQAQ